MIFVGAGLSFLSRTKNGDRVPDGASLIDYLLEQPLGTGSRHPLDRVAGYAARTKGNEFVYDLIMRNLTVTSVDSRLTRLYDLPWRRIYTTNYDNAIELAIKSKRAFSSLTIDDQISKAAPGSIIHLNGYIDRVSPANIQRNLALTDYSYATSRLLESEWFKFFLRDLRSARAIIFVGYSLADLDIQRALISEDSLSRKCFFFVSPTADALEVDAIATYGTLIPGGVDVLVSDIESVASDYSGVKFSNAYTALREVIVDPGQNNSATNAQKITDQLVYGKLPEIEVLHNEKIFGDRPFLVLRKQDRSAIEAIRSGPWRDLLYVGELASGKTASALNMTTYFIGEGYRVFYAQHCSFCEVTA